MKRQELDVKCKRMESVWRKYLSFSESISMMDDIERHLRFQYPDFFTAPASTRFHSNYEGGLFEHSLEVANSLCELTKRLNLTWSRNESPMIVGLLHDLCKVDQYKHPDIDGKPIVAPCNWVRNENTLFTGHGEKSVMMTASIIALTEEEAACICYHMGAFTDSNLWNNYTRAVNRYPNVLFTHTADMMATHIAGV